MSNRKNEAMALEALRKEYCSQREETLVLADVICLATERGIQRHDFTRMRMGVQCPSAHVAEQLRGCYVSTYGGYNFSRKKLDATSDSSEKARILSNHVVGIPKWWRGWVYAILVLRRLLVTDLDTADGVTRGVFSNYASAGHLPTKKNWNRLCRILKVDSEQLLGNQPIPGMTADIVHLGIQQALARPNTWLSKHLAALHRKGEAVKKMPLCLGEEEETATTHTHETGTVFATAIQIKDHTSALAACSYDLYEAVGMLIRATSSGADSETIASRFTEVEKKWNDVSEVLSE